ncbi:MAG TPA: hypothetical protein ENI34_04775 [candidate division WOR-3 bacterium]|uniref:Regulatory protein RecX n=1 Tax=candidate division WOR-3 bacterium TaxID=2052148 RepID=A0A9C9EN75_UNCW3|nr:hypothetical protein [candidate division WOR-3 bacterium]
MKISKIEVQKRNKNRCSIYIDGEFKVGLARELVLKYDLHEGNRITPEELKNILYNAEKSKIRERAFKILRHRERSSRELKERLLRIGFDEMLVEEVIKEFVDDKTIDDERFARAFVNDYTKLKPKGNRFIFRELLKRGISRETITSLVNARNEKVLIEAFINKKLTHLNQKVPEERRKLIRRLLHHGFSIDNIYDVLNERR